jgi:hypothetical protein
MMATEPTTKTASVAALWTFAFTLVGTAIMLLTGWLGDVANWVASDDESVVFPSAAPLVKVGVALALAVVIALVNFLYRWLQTKESITKFLPGASPTYDK